MYNKKYTLIFCMIFLMAISFVSATDLYKTGNNMNVTISCDNINCSDGDINITILDEDHSIVVDNQVTTAGNGYVYYTTNLTDGNYFYYLASDNDYYASSFVASESGMEISEGRSILSIGVLFIMCLFLFVTLYSLFSVDDYRGKFVLYWVSHILVILTTFVGWQIGVEGLLSGLAITGIFKILFWFFLIASFPMLILSLAWIFYIHTMNEHFERLIEKGEDPETAFKLVYKKNKRRRW